MACHLYFTVKSPCRPALTQQLFSNIFAKSMCIGAEEGLSSKHLIHHNIFLSRILYCFYTKIIFNYLGSFFLLNQL